MTRARHLQILRDLTELRQKWPAFEKRIDDALLDLKRAWSAERARLAKRSAATAAAIKTFCESVS